MGTAFVAVVFDAKFNVTIRRIVPPNRSGAWEACPRAPRQLAFTLVEVMVSLALLTMLTVCATWAFGQMNASAASSRVNTCAQMVAQNYIDGFLSAEPYNPQLSPAQLPQFSASPVCTMVAPQTVTGNNVPIYTDPAGTLTVTGTVTLAVADLAINQTTNGVTQSLNARRLRVTLAYTFRGQAYSVVLNTIRVSDF